MQRGWQRIALLILWLGAGPGLLSHVAATDLPAEIRAPMTLTTAQSPYYLRQTVIIAPGVTLTVEPGVKIIATGDYSLFVGGMLTGGAASGAPIEFRAESGTPGAWQGLYVPRGGCVRLTNAQIRQAVNNITLPGGELHLTGCVLAQAAGEGIFAWGACVLEVQGCDFRENAGRGLYVEGFEATGTVRDCQFVGQGSYPVQLKATLVEMLGSGNVYTNNGRERIGVSCSLAEDITDQDFWEAQAVPFELGAGGGDTSLAIGPSGQLTIAAGTLLYGGDLECKGRLEMRGTTDRPVIWTAAPESRTRGAWRGLTFRPGSVGNIQQTRIAYAATGITADSATSTIRDAVIEECAYDGARLTGASLLNVQNVIFRNVGREGVRLEEAALTGEIRACQFLNCGRYPVWSLASALRCLKGDNVYAGNGVERIGVHCGLTPDLASGDHVWTAQSAPLDFGADPSEGVLYIASGASLTIPGGTTIYAQGVEVYGRLIISGTSAQPCLFLPLSGAQRGAWNGLRYIGGSGAVRGAIVRYGLNGLTLSNASPPVEESVFWESRYDGLVCLGSARPVVRRCAFLNNGRHGVYIADGARPNLGDLSNSSLADQGENTLQGNGGYEIYNETSNEIRAQNNTWGTNDVNVIMSRIYDRSDQAARGAVIFQPIQMALPSEAPWLYWSGDTGYTSDGVEPDTGPAGTCFQFRVKYKDPFGLAPTFVRLYVMAGESPLPGSPFELTLMRGATYATGALYGCDLVLPSGRSYWY